MGIKNSYRKFRISISLFFLLGLISCNNKTLFKKISSSHSGITFENKIIENDSINPLTKVNLYSGGGVGIGDFNNDGLQDIYLTGGMVPCKLYLNKGNFKFEDITAKSGVEGEGRWARGVSIIDINNDGLMDIYISNTLYKDSLRRRNVLYINLGNDKDGIPHFKDLACEYGLDINLQSTMASFFDYDNDGDLDMYLTVNEASNDYVSSVFIGQNGSSSGFNKGRLYRNDMDSSLGHIVFKDVSNAAGIKFEGYGHAATICDINNDGWKDIYVSNDFISNNILYINNHDGTFTNQSKEYFKHTSYNSMGQDVVDINNDGLPDVIELDMRAEDNYRKKMMSDANNTNIYQNFENYGYQYQYVRNTLQLNQGPRINSNDSIGIPAFSEIAFMSGISETDWSWTPMIVDFDNDGYRDIVITNGYPKDWSDHDFIAYRQKANGKVSYMDLLKLIPEVKLHNYAFRNNGKLFFEDVTQNWGLSLPTFSNGAAYADFDNDGAMDMVINNINDEALVYRNTSRDHDRSSHYLNIFFKGGKQNVNGIGTVVNIYYDNGKQQTYDNNPFRGYLSTVQCMAHFGLGKTTNIDSVVIRWNKNKSQVFHNLKVDQSLTVDIKDANENDVLISPLIALNTLFKDITKAKGITYIHNDFPSMDFNIQALLLHKFSEYTPSLAASDINGDGLDDLVIGGNRNNQAKVLFQQKNGNFIQRDLVQSKSNQSMLAKDEGMLLFDANGDGYNDLYIAAGGYSNSSESSIYQDKLYINDGKGNFTDESYALPKNYTSKLCVRAFDYNNDGKLDLFVSGRVAPGQYPKPVSSIILRNDTENGKVKFTDVSEKVAPDLKNIGMISDALFTDFDGDGKIDLIAVGEWMPITFFKNLNGFFKNVTPLSGVSNKIGWWNSISAGDFRHKGRTDYIIGNVGLNTFYKGNDEYPIHITAKDFDKNGIYISIPSLYLLDENGEKKEYPSFGRDDIASQWPIIKKRFDTYKPFALATMEDILTTDQRKGVLRLQANMMQSCYLRNDGEGKFALIPLPVEVQFSQINAMLADDFDGDGNLDVLMTGNDFGTEVSTGRYDAFNGLLLKGDGNGNFTPQTILQSGIYIPGNGKALVKLLSSDGNYLIAASQHNEALKLYQLKRKLKKIIKLNFDDKSGMVHFNNGKTRKIEFYYGSSFLSQSSRFIEIENNVKSITLINNKGESRSLSCN